MRRALLLLMLFPLAFAALEDCEGEGSLGDMLWCWSGQMNALIVPLAMVLVVVGAAVYVISQFFGADLRARASVYVSNLLTAAGVAVLILILFYAMLPYVQGAHIRFDLEEQFSILMELARTSLMVLILVMVIASAGIYVLGQLFGADTRARATVWATGMLAGAIVAAILYVVLTSVLTPFMENLSFPHPIETFANYLGVLMVITFLVIFILLITYLLSKIFNVPEWEAYLNIELTQLLNSFLVIIFVIAMFTVSEVFVMGMSSDGAAVRSPSMAAALFLKEWVTDSVMTGMFDVFQIQACTSILSMLNRRIGEFVLTNVFKLFPGMDTFVSITNVLAFGLVSVYGSLSFQISILTFIDAVAVPFLLPAGLLLRFFPPTRDAGAFLISMAFCFQIIFPGTFLVHERVLNEIGAEKYDSPRLLIASLCGPFKYGVAGLLINTGTNPIFSIPIPGMRALGTVLMSLTQEFTLNIVSMAEFLPILRLMAELSLLSLFMPALSTIITIAFINGMTKFLVSKV